MNWAVIGWILLGAVIGAIIAFFVTKKMFEKQLKDNPPINESMIYVWAMGRKPSGRKYVK